MANSPPSSQPSGFQMSPVPFLGIYALNSPLGDAKGEIYKTSTHSVQLATGPFGISTSMPIRLVGPGGGGITVGEQKLQFPQGRYLLVQTERQFNEPLTPYASASLEVNEVAAKISILCPGLIAERKFEGFVNRPGSIVMAGPSPMRVVARPDDDPKKVVTDLAAFDAALRSQPADVKERFRLAARWYALGHMADNFVDRLLSWFISLEVHPGAGTTDIPGAVRDYLHSYAYPSIDPNDLKARILIGPITGMRADIVHNGKAHVGPTEDTLYTKRLEALEATVRTCLRVLAGLPPGSALDSIVHPPSTP